ncbi:MAG: UDP-N-acetylmuramate dehydrogenase [Clostridia bacterium]|nr:UDP-N-acetylmuramate dehydrogenase [Clostridia bacterium]
METGVFKAIAPQLIINEPMSKHTTFKIGGAADMYVSATGTDELLSLIKAAKDTKIPYMIKGNGSNMLVGDGGIRGLVIEIGAGMSDISVNGNIVTAGAGALLSKVASEAARASLTGFEPLSGIPGTLGGGLYMNAGAYGGEMKQVVKTVTYTDDNGNIKTIRGDECGFGYRSSIFTDGGKYIVSAELELRPGKPEEIRAAMSDYNKRRTEKQPLSYPSAGSVFKRPEGYFAGALIEGAGLKGKRIGGAEVSELHAGFIINVGGATAADVLDLIGYVQKTVKDRYGVELETEVRLIGEQ